jgi:anti-sigma factor RsiW
MRHPITAEQWISYLGGELEQGEASRMEAHLAACADCRGLAEELREADRCLSGILGELRRTAQLETEVVERARLLFFERVRCSRDAGEPLRASVLRLQELLAPMCGLNTARLMLNKAAECSEVRTPEEVTAERWPAFVTGVVRVLKPLCGEPAAMLVWEASRM